MSAPRKGFAIVEWEFIRFDQAYRALPDHDTRLAYLHLWAVCVHLRRDTFEKDELPSEYMADLCGVDVSLLARMLGVASARLVKKGPRGSLTVVGVRRKHRTLRGWNARRLLRDCGPSAASDRDRDMKTLGAAPPTPEKSFSEDHPAYQIACFLLDAIRSHRPNSKQPDLQAWAVEADRMLRIEKRSVEEAKAVINWAHRDPAGWFWKGNMLCTKTLRNKFDQIAIKMRSPAPPQEDQREAATHPLFDPKDYKRG